MEKNQKTESGFNVGPHIKPIPHAVANSFAEWMNAQDVDFVITHPEGLDLDPDFCWRCKSD